MEQRTQIIPLKLPNEVIIYAESTVLSGEEDVAFDLLRFADLNDTLEGIAGALAATLQKVKPQKASVEFGLELAVDSGKLTSVLVKGAGKANLKVVLEWSEQR